MMVIQTLCHMDLRVSELRLLTVEAVKKGKLSVTRRKYTRERVNLQKLKMPRMHDYYPFYPVVDYSLAK